MAQFSFTPFQLLISPLAVFPLPPFVPLSTYLAPSNCDRNRPPPSQVACKLTLFAPPFTQLSLPFQFPRTPNCPTPSKDDLGTIPLLLCGTVTQNIWQHHFVEPCGGGGALWNKLTLRVSGNSHTL